MPTETPETILVVDDLDTNRILAASMLEDAGYRVLQASSGAEAIEIAARSAVDLVLLDLMMPGMNGFDTCRAMRATPHGATTPILFLTALADLQTHRQALESGGDDFLTKPIDRVELLMRVRSLVRIKRLQVSLESANATLTAQRDALIDEALARARIAAMLVHDLKTPLASVLGNVKYVIDTEGIPGDARDAALDVMASASRMSRMVVDLLDVARSEEGRIHPRAQRFDAGALLRECARTAERSAAERSHTIEVDVPQRVDVTADPDLLRRVIENLLDNALGHAPARSTVRIGARREDADLMLHVADRGAGIPDERKLQVFEPYVQVEPLAEPSPRRASRGLGLAFCKLAIEAHRGAIWIEDNEPSGVIVRARVPIESAGVEHAG